MEETDATSIANATKVLKAHFYSGITRDYDYRVAQIKGVLELAVKHEDELADALRKDLGRPHMEAVVADIGIVKSEITHVLANLHQWMKNDSVPTPAMLLPGSSEIRRDPHGLVLIIGPFNYPVQLTLVPIVSALAAGNVVILKPSELSPATALTLQALLHRYIDPNCLRVVTGGVSTTQELLQQPLDFIFFTGSPRVGRIIAKSAADKLIPTLLELGGKCPSVIDSNVNLRVAARRIAFSKWLNAAQTCLATDFALVHESVYDAFVGEVIAALSEFSGDDSPKNSKSFSRIVGKSHTQRLVSLLDKTRGTVSYGGDYSIEDCYISPTVVTGVLPSDSLMEEELFGPILPIVQYSTREEALEIISMHPKPLALYCFSNSDEFCEFFYNNVQSGGVCYNDCMMHAVNPFLPFGGVGNSGIGSYHGIFGFHAFSHTRSVLKKSTMLDAAQRYPPYDSTKETVFKTMVEYSGVTSATLTRAGLVALAAVGLGVAHSRL